MGKVLHAHGSQNLLGTFCMKLKEQLTLSHLIFVYLFERTDYQSFEIMYYLCKMQN